MPNMRIARVDADFGSRDGLSASRTFGVGTLFFRPLLVLILSWRERQPAGIRQKIAFLRREHALEALGLNYFLALFGRHGSKIADGSAHRAAPVRRKLL